MLHPFIEREFEWANIPALIKKNAEMRFHGPVVDGLYGTYGVDSHVGAVAVIRPDGYVGVVSSLTSAHHVSEYLRRCLVTVT